VHGAQAGGGRQSQLSGYKSSWCYVAAGFELCLPQKAEDIALGNFCIRLGGADIMKIEAERLGIGMRSQAGVAHRMFEALARDGVNIKVITTSEIKVSVLIDRKYLELAVQALHDAFELEKTS
jgi:aspartate kinase